VTASVVTTTDYLAASATLTITVTASSKLSSSTALEISRSSVTYGDEGDVTFSATVTGSGSTLPTGTVTFKAGATTLCSTSTLSRQSSHAVLATCSLTDSQLPVGSYSVTATYSGDSHYASSTSSPAQSFSVTKDSTSLSVSVSPSSVRHGSETSAVFTVTITTGNGEPLPASEDVTVSVGGATCTAVVTPSGSGGTGKCSLTNGSALAANSRAYTVTASYGGDTDLTGSTATARSGLTVTS